MHTYTFVGITTTKEKEGMDLNKNMGGFEGKTGKGGNDIILL